MSASNIIKIDASKHPHQEPCLTYVKGFYKMVVFDALGLTNYEEKAAELFYIPIGNLN